MKISKSRIKSARKCFAYYFTARAIKQQGNILSSAYYAFNASHYFFLDSYNG